MSRFANARFLVSAAAASQFPPDHGVEVAFAGRSNAGKSSAINALVSRRALARTSKTPGRTRLVNFFDLGGERRLVDLPGYGYASGPAEERNTWGPLIAALRERRALRGLYVMVDGRRGLREPDLELIAWADPAVRRIHVLLTKSDQLKRREAVEVLRTTRAALAQSATAQLFSAREGEGLAEAQQVLLGWLDDAGVLGEGGFETDKKFPGGREATGAD